MLKTFITSPLTHAFSNQTILITSCTTSLSMALVSIITKTLTIKTLNNWGHVCFYFELGISDPDKVCEFRQRKGVFKITMHVVPNAATLFRQITQDGILDVKQKITTKNVYCLMAKIVQLPWMPNLISALWPFLILLSPWRCLLVEINHPYEHYNHQL